MKGHTSVIGSHTGLWTMMLGAGVLAVLLVLACAGTTAVVFGVAISDLDGVGVRI